MKERLVAQPFDIVDHTCSKVERDWVTMLLLETRITDQRIVNSIGSQP
jgi:hypothetical protein